jgi:hypothetical protein
MISQDVLWAVGRSHVSKPAGYLVGVTVVINTLGLLHHNFGQWSTGHAGNKLELVSFGGIRAL